MTRSASTSRSGGLIWGVNGRDLDLGLSTAEIKKPQEIEGAHVALHKGVFHTCAAMVSNVSEGAAVTD